MPGREQQVSAAFVSIADALIVEPRPDLAGIYGGLTADCARILHVFAAGVMLADRPGVLHVMAASCDQARDLQIYQLVCGEGPCLDCYQSGVAVCVPDLAAEVARWPRFAPVALAAGFASVHAVPMRPRETTFGVLGLFGTGAGVLAAEDLALAHALAHVGGSALVAGRAAVDKTALTEQLQGALNSRVVLEQAKGIVAQTGGLEMDQAFAVLRRWSRDHNLPLSHLAAQVVARESPPTALITHARAAGVLAAVARH